jgi:hypothetical protein
MFNPKQNRATLIRVSLWVIFSVSRTCLSADTYRRKIVQNIASRFIGKYPKGGDGENTACDERDCGRYVGNARKAIERRRAQATIYEEGVVVTNEREADDTDRLEHAWANESKPFRRISF